MDTLVPLDSQTGVHESANGIRPWHRLLHLRGALSRGLGDCTVVYKWDLDIAQTPRSSRSDALAIAIRVCSLRTDNV